MAAQMHSEMGHTTSKSFEIPGHVISNLCKSSSGFWTFLSYQKHGNLFSMHCSDSAGSFKFYFPYISKVCTLVQLKYPRLATGKWKQGNWRNVLILGGLKSSGENDRRQLK